MNFVRPGTSHTGSRVDESSKQFPLHCIWRTSLMVFDTGLLTLSVLARAYIW